MKYDYELEPRKKRRPNRVKCVEGNVVTLLDSKDREFKVSLESLNDVMKYTWKITKRKNTSYVNTTFRKERIVMYLHRFLLKVQSGIVDHINHDGTDNTLENIRLVTKQENSYNYLKSRGSSKYLGVSFNKRRGKWLAKFAQKRIGYFISEDEAALAYNIYKLSISPTYSTINHIN